MSPDLEFATRPCCTLDLEMSYGRFAAKKFTTMIVESENNIVLKLSREEILTVYREFDNDLCRPICTREEK